MSLKIRKLTEEEIQKLPYPETAKKIGGILEIHNDLNEQEVEKLKESWYNNFKGPAIKCPVLDMPCVKKAMRQKLIKGLEEYEAFTRMHLSNGTNSNSKCPRKL